MRFTRFYYPQSLAGQTLVELDEAAAHHAAKVLRLTLGDGIVLFDGNGGEYAARIAGVSKHAVSAAIERHLAVEREASTQVCVAQAVSTGERMDFTLEKCTELGAASFQPVIAQRSVVRLSEERAQRRREHWQRVVISACEQCGRNRVPPVAPVTDLHEWLTAPSAATRVVLAPEAKQRLGEAVQAAANIELLVGPEGGFTDDELAAAMRAGYTAVSLGPRVLRTETAAAAALAALHALRGDL